MLDYIVFKQIGRLIFWPKSIRATIKSNFKPNLKQLIAEGGHSKIFKATFHGRNVAIKYVPLDKMRSSYTYERDSYGCHEFDNQERIQNERFGLFQLQVTFHTLSY